MTDEPSNDPGSKLSSTAAEEVAGNEDLLNDILLRLPVKSLIRFQLVSKQWLYLISDPQFTRNHTHCRDTNSFAPSGLFFYNSPSRSIEIDSVSLDDIGSNQPSRLRARVPPLSFLDAVASGAPITILHSCNGLLLCHFTSQTSDSEVSHYCVCNPTTKKYAILPQAWPTEKYATLPQAWPSMMASTLAFSPWESRHYKVVSVKTQGNVFQVDVYSSENESWRSCDCSFTSPKVMCFLGGVYWNGSIFWIIRMGRMYFTIRFGINAEDLIAKATSPGSANVSRWTIGYFGECGSHLHLIYIDTICPEHFNVLEMDRETFNWSMKYKVQFDLIISAFSEIVWKRRSGMSLKKMYPFSVLCVVRGEKEEDSVLVLTVPGKVISYNFKHMTSNVLCELPGQVIETSRFNCVHAYQYIETLSCI